MKILTYQVTLDEPVLVTALGGDPNSGVAFDYLPGSVLRGAIIGAYQRESGQGVLDAGTDLVRRLFFDGRTQYLNAYPIGSDDHPRACPVPRSWQLEKNQPHPIYDFAVEVPANVDRRQWKHVGAPFYRPITKPGTEPMVDLINPTRHISVHTTRTRRYGRAMPAEHLPDGDLPGAVYRYDALAPGQTFAAAILCEENTDAATLQSLLEKATLLLGGARSAGYGRAYVHDVTEVGDWQEVPVAAIGSRAHRLAVLLLSDLLLRDAAGQWTVDPKVVAERITAHLGLPGESFTGEAYVAATVVGGFNRTWGLPLPQCPATAMGSVFLFERPDGPLDGVHAKAVVGLGERRAEGFGRLVCTGPKVETWNLAPEKEPPRIHTVPPRKTQDLPALAIKHPDAVDLAQAIAERLLRRRLEEAVRAAAARPRLRGVPSNAQLSRLRALLYAQLQSPTPNLAILDSYVADLSQRASTRRQFAVARLDDAPLLHWLHNLLRPDDAGGQYLEPANWQDLLGLQENDLQVSIGSITAQVTPALRIEYTVRYVAAVLARAARIRSKEAS